MITDKKGVPGPPNYQTGNYKVNKIKGFYGNSENKFSTTSSIAYEKRFIPGPNVYESRGKAMSQILNEKAKNFLYEYNGKKADTGVRVKKTNEPAPTSYEVGVAVDKTSQKLDTIKYTIPKDKNQGYIRKIKLLFVKFFIFMCRSSTEIKENCAWIRQLSNFRKLQITCQANNAAKNEETLRELLQI